MAIKCVPCGYSDEADAGRGLSASLSLWILLLLILSLVIFSALGARIHPATSPSITTQRHVPHHPRTPRRSLMPRRALPSLAALGFCCRIRCLRNRVLRRTRALAQVELRQRSSPVDLLRALAPSLTVVAARDVACDETCAICLAELARDGEEAQREGEGGQEGEGSAASSPSPPAQPPAPPSTRASAPRALNRALSRSVASLSGGSGLLPWSARRRAAAAAAAAAAAEDDTTEIPSLVHSGETVLSLRCGHRFHAECIHGWIVHKGYHASCPLCKLPIAAPTRSTDGDEEGSADSSDGETSSDAASPLDAAAVAAAVAEAGLAAGASPSEPASPSGIELQGAPPTAERPRSPAGEAARPTATRSCSPAAEGDAEEPVVAALAVAAAAPLPAAAAEGLPTIAAARHYSPRGRSVRLPASLGISIVRPAGEGAAMSDVAHV